MEPSEFPSNAHPSPRSRPGAEAVKAPDAKLAQITTAKTRKKPLRVKFKEAFTPGDTKGMGEYIKTDLLLPTVKDLLNDIIDTTKARILYGNNGSPMRRGVGQMAQAGYTSYARMGMQAQGLASAKNDSQVVDKRARANFNFDQIVIPTRVEAESVLDQMFAIVAQYRAVSVRNLYDIVGMDAQYTDESWGWTDVRGSKVHRVPEGFLLDLPRPIPLD